MNPNLQAEFWQILAAAKHAGQMVDDFDLHSEDPQSSRHFQRLLDESRTAALRLIDFVVLNAVQLQQDLAD